jgi:hypothetical protein
MPKRMSRPSPALVVSLIALFVALGGTGYAAVKINGKNLKSKSVSGAKLKNKTITGAKIKNRTITAGKVKSNTLTGTQIDEAKLGTVPSAVNATNATNATNLNGVVKWGPRKETPTSGASLAAAMAAAPEIPLTQVGPLSVYGKCVTDNSGPSTLALVLVKTSESQTVFSSQFAILAGSPSYLDPGTVEFPNRLANVASAGNNAAGVSPFFAGLFTARTTDGSSYIGHSMAAAKRGTPVTGDGIYGPGDVCLFMRGSVEPL